MRTNEWLDSYFGMPFDEVLSIAGLAPPALPSPPKSNVIIPDLGAGPYWYVDPRAGQPQQPEYSGFNRPVPDEGDILPGNSAAARMIGANQDFSTLSDEQYNAAYNEHERSLEPEYRMGPQDVYKTVGMEINGKEWEVPAVFDNMTDQDRAIIQGLPHTQWPGWVRDSIENNARDELEKGYDPFGNPMVGF